MAKLEVEIVSGERIVLSESDVDMVVAPGTDGVLGILPKHAPLISTLAPGELRVKKGGREESIIVFGGFIEVTPEKVTILADSAERIEEIDLSRAEEARRRAEEAVRQRGETIEMGEALTALRRANLRLNVGRRHRRPGASPVAGGPENPV
jgi:F-type H+-transporting ATPase subunit epsilon